MITTILIGLIVTVVMASMYWQPSFGGGYHGPPRRTPREEYIKMIEELIWQGRYTKVRDMLEEPTYPLRELPLADWRRTLSFQRKEPGNWGLSDAIDSLEKMLK